jgi:hypothetical protein
MFHPLGPSDGQLFRNGIREGLQTIRPESADLLSGTAFGNCRLRSIKADWISVSLSRGPLRGVCHLHRVPPFPPFGSTWSTHHGCPISRPRHGSTTCARIGASRICSAAWTYQSSWARPHWVQDWVQPKKVRTTTNFRQTTPDTALRFSTSSAVNRRVASSNRGGLALVSFFVL